MLVRKEILLNASCAPYRSSMLQIRQLLQNIQPLSSILIWSHANPTDSEIATQASSLRVPISFIEMPLLGLSFEVEHDNEGMKIEAWSEPTIMLYQ